MIKVVVDIPNDKMSSFLNMIVNLGIENHVIVSQYSLKEKGKKNPSKSLKSLTKFLLFDWEFFNNELEFE